MSRLGLCIKKDRIEYLRSSKVVVSCIMLGAFMAVLLILTAVVPKLTEMIDVSMELDIVNAGIVAITGFLKEYFPQNLLDNCAFFSTEVGLFYSILVIAFSFNVLPRDIKSGRLILPICNGYKQSEIFLSKQIVYSLFAAIPAGLFYLIYYFIGYTFLDRNYPIQQALIGAVVMCFNIFAIVAITIALSVIYKHAILVIITMGLTVAASPDLLYALPFGKYIPTYLFTYLNYSLSDARLLIIPVLEYVVIIVILDLLVIKRKFKVVVDERR